ncbi:RsmB/NOP family class I SAM-dependent RNA methyltransferase [uncultured Tateyamaria sp.]|uniref:RsmB/NOP family class I SAM-dependent RNA methyltransferase n=1 Tax=Tateyamaria sp. 1078 TaxID=3417464 RepID=UPI002617F1FD|nr:RsmB/NOP family class I SAM-dependent RNA methyltransferase [uncultured Tateyamaria sp.]
MTPGARVAAAIEILDHIAGGTPAEQALTRWARASRYAGSKDRAAVRDHVFDVLRHWRSAAAYGGGETGRARMIGRLRDAGADLATLFDGNGHAPAPVTKAETGSGAAPTSRAETLDLPDWLLERFDASLGADTDRTARALQRRAPVTLRVNASRGTVADAVHSLADAGVQTIANPRADSALTIEAGERKLRNSDAYTNGLVELQDAASQAAVAQIAGSGRVLDYCAGGGGKALALAAAGWTVTAHDADPSRMRDLPARATRGGHDLHLSEPSELTQMGRFDAVLCDAPCSGAGTWRRAPEAKWRLTPDRLAELTTVQAQILDTAQVYVTPGGALYYATCSVLVEENAAQSAAFVARNPEWRLDADWHWPVDDWGDGFYLARLLRA